MGMNDDRMAPSKDMSDSGACAFDTVVMPSRFVTMAVNYEPPSVKGFLSPRRKGRPQNLNSPTGNTSAAAGTENAPNIPSEEGAATEAASVMGAQTRGGIGHDSHSSGADPNRTTPKDESTRRSAREKKRETPLNKCRVRYDMQLVPPARRHRAFLDRFPRWWSLPGARTIEEAAEASSSNKSLERRSNRLVLGKAGLACDYCDGPTLQPFTEDTSVLWIPKTRAEWDDTVSELTAVCTSASMRRYQADKYPSMPFHPPLSREYIRDRVDIDDPLHGYQLRHKAGGWLQGFVLWTNFTTWTHHFHWDSLHEKSGIVPSDAHCDVDGSVARDLEAQERAGDPHGEGIVFPLIAEIALVGGLACGEYMVRLALEDIRAARKYKYVVLQSTDQSKAFYERFGFIRVGAVCRYGFSSEEEMAQPVEGYRHWTHANESEKSLELHGGPSYMMCLKLPEDGKDDACPACGRRITESANPDFKKAMLSILVEEKPVIEQLGASFTPGSKQRRVGALGSVYRDLKARRALPISDSKKSPALQALPVSSRKRKHDDKPERSKRRKLNNSPENTTSDNVVYSTSRGSMNPNQFVPVSSADIDSGNETTYQLKFDLHPDDPPFSLIQGSKGRCRTVSHSSSHSHSSMPKPKLSNIPDSDLKPSSEADEIIKEADRLKTIGYGDPHGSPKSIERRSLTKQKVKAYPRSRIHFFNRVVKPLHGPRVYYFVLHFDEREHRLCLAPLEPRGRLSGKRLGRPRYQVVLEETNANFLTVSCDGYAVVPATMIMKTPLVASEAWDIEDDS